MFFQSNCRKRIKAVLKPPHSKRLRDCRTALNLAERVECGAFTAAFARTAPGLFRPGQSLPAQ